MKKRRVRIFDDTEQDLELDEILNEQLNKKFELSDYVTKLWLEFKDPKLEESFEETYLSQYLSSIRKFFLLLFGTHLILYLQDYSSYLKTNNLHYFTVILIIRSVFTCIFLAISILSFANPGYFKQIWRRLYPIFIVSLYCSYAIMGFLPWDTSISLLSYSYLRTVTYMIMFTCCFSRLKLRQSIILCILLFSIYTISAGINMVPNEMSLALGFLILVMILCISSNRNTEVELRRTFILDNMSKLEITRIMKEKSKSDHLLKNIMPANIIDRINTKSADSIKMKMTIFQEVSVILVDIVSFTQQSSSMSPLEILSLLNSIYSQFDAIVEKNQLEKIKTIGDAYLAVSGLPIPLGDHASKAAQCALEMMESIQNINKSQNSQLQVRIGITKGPIIAGIIGKERVMYDIFGSTVLEAEATEHNSVPGKIHISKVYYDHLKKETTKYQYEILEYEHQTPKIFLTGLYQTGRSVTMETPMKTDTTIPYTNTFLSLAQRHSIHLEKCETKKFTLEYSNKSIENSFALYFRSLSVKPLRQSSISTCLSIVFFAEGLEFIAPGYPNLYTHIVRFLIIFPVIILTALSTVPFNCGQNKKVAYWTNISPSLFQTIVAGNILLSIIFCRVSAVFVIYYYFYGTIIGIVLLDAKKIMWKFAFLVCLILTLANIPITFYFDTTEYKIEDFFFLLILTIYGCGSVYFKEKYCRDEFLSTLRLTIQQKNLISEENKTNRILLNILPESVAKKLKEMEFFRPYENHIYDFYPEAFIMFITIPNYHDLCNKMKLNDLASFLVQVYELWDNLIVHYQLQKIKAIGGTFLVVSGIDKNKAGESTGLLALDLVEQSSKLTILDQPLSIQVGISCGPIVAGVIGTKKWFFDVWGDSVNLGSRMATSATNNRIQVTEKTYEETKNHFEYENRGLIHIHGKGSLSTYWMTKHKL